MRCWPPLSQHRNTAHMSRISTQITQLVAVGCGALVLAAFTLHAAGFVPDEDAGWPREIIAGPATVIVR